MQTDAHSTHLVMNFVLSVIQDAALFSNICCPYDDCMISVCTNNWVIWHAHIFVRHATVFAVSCFVKCTYFTHCKINELFYLRTANTRSMLCKTNTRDQPNWPWFYVPENSLKKAIFFHIFYPFGCF